MDPPVLECRQVTAGYRSKTGPPKVVLENVNLTLLHRQTLLVLGASGGGKSTLLRLLNRFDDPISGQVLFHGQPLPTLDVLDLRRRVALVPQTPCPFEGTVRDNFRVRPAGMPPPEEPELAVRLGQVGLSTELLEQPANELSVGQMQRLGMARALCNRPEVLLLDEPTSALDPSAGRAIAKLIETLRTEEDLSFVVVTHQPDLATHLHAVPALISGGSLELNPASSAIAAFFAGEPDT